MVSDNYQVTTTETTINMRTVIASTAGLLVLGNAVSVNAAAGDFNAVIAYTASACSAGTATSLVAQPTLSDAACSTVACGGTGGETKCLTAATYETVRVAEFADKSVFTANTFATSACTGAPTKYEVMVGDGTTCIKTGASTSATYEINPAKTLVTRKTYAALACAGTATVTQYKAYSGTPNSCETGNKLLTFMVKDASPATTYTTYKLKEVVPVKAVFKYSGAALTDCVAGTALTMTLTQDGCTPGLTSANAAFDEIACATNGKTVCADLATTVRDTEFGATKKLFLTTTYADAPACTASTVAGSTVNAVLADDTCIKLASAEGSANSYKYTISADGKTVTRKNYSDNACATQLTAAAATTDFTIGGNTCDATATTKKYSVVGYTAPPTGAAAGSSNPAAALLAVFSLAMVL